MWWVCWYNIAIGVFILGLLGLVIHLYFRYPKNLDCIVASAGGGGTTYLLNYLHEHTSLRTNDLVNYDGLKHPSRKLLDTIYMANPRKVLYVFNDPALAIESHFRRGYVPSLLANLDNPHNLTYMNGIDAKKHYYADVSVQRMDLFGIENQFDFVTSGELPCDVLCIDFPRLNDQDTRDRVAEFLEIPVQSLSTIHVRASRHSDTKHLPTEYVNVYSALYAKMKKMHGIIVHPSGKTPELNEN